MKTMMNWESSSHEQPTSMFLSDSRCDFQMDSGGAIDMPYRKHFFQLQSGTDPQLTFPITDRLPVYPPGPMMTDFDYPNYPNPSSTEQTTPLAFRQSPSTMDGLQSHKEDQSPECSGSSNIIRFQHDGDTVPDDLSSPTFHHQAQGVERDDSTAERHSDTNTGNHRNPLGKRNRKKMQRAPPGRKDSIIGADEEQDEDQDDEEEGDYDGHNKREKFLERNRVAASKCRRKKKQWTEQLESQLKTLAAERSQLRAAESKLRNNLLDLKDLLIQHVDCDCVSIRQYLNQMVAQKTPYAPVYRLAEQATKHNGSSCPHAYSGSSDTMKPALDVQQYRFDSPMFSPTDEQPTSCMAQPPPRSSD